jgi:hypothetical protein
MSLLSRRNNLKIAFKYFELLPFNRRYVLIKMQDGQLFRKRNFKNRHVSWMLALKKYWPRILGTSSAFFLYDFVNFPNIIMSAAIMDSLACSKNVRTVAIWQLILALFPVPGLLLGAWLVNKIGRKWTSVAGFTGYIVLGFIIGGCYEPLTTKPLPAFVVLYGLFACMGQHILLSP